MAILKCGLKTKALTHRGIFLLAFFSFFLSGFSNSHAVPKTKYRVMSDASYPPYEFNKKGIPSGFSIDLLRAIADQMQIDLDIQSVPWNEAIDSLKAGKIDMLSCVYYTKERSKFFDFSHPYAVSGFVFFVGDNSDIKSVKDIEGRSIAVQEGNSIEFYCRANFKSSKLIEVPGPLEQLLYVKNGQADCALMPKIQGLHIIDYRKIKGLKALNSEVFQEKNCFGVKKSDTELLLQLNEGLNIIMTSGRYRQIYEKWFGQYDAHIFSRGAKYIFWALNAAAGLLAICLLWLYTLKRQVRKKTLDLKRSEIKYRNILENAPFGIFHFDESGTMTNANTACAEMLGYASAEELINVINNGPGIDCICADQICREKLITRVLQTDGWIFDEIKLKKKDGSLILAELSIRTVRDEKGQTGYAEGFLKDTTSIKIAYENLRNSEEKYRTLADFTYGWENWSDRDEKLLYISQACQRISGYSRDEFYADPELFVKIMLPEDRPEYLQNVAKLKSGELPACSTDARITCKSGRIKWISHLSRVVITEDGRHLGYRSTNIDITERKSYEASLAGLLKIQKTVSQVNQHIIHASTEEILFKNVCETIAENGSYDLVFAGLLSQGYDDKVRIVACAGKDIDFMNDMSIRWKYGQSSQGSFGQAVREQRIVISRDVQNNEDYEYRKEELKSYGFTSTMSLPIFVSGQTIGALTIYLAGRAEFEPEEIALLKDMAEDLSFAASTIRMRQEHQRVLLELKKNEERLKIAISNTGLGTWDWDMENDRVVYDESYLEQIGYTAKEIQMNLDFWRNRVYPLDYIEVMKALRLHVEGKTELFKVEHRLQRKDGRWVWVQVAGRIISRKPDGTPLRMLGTHLDITDKRLQEERIRKMNEELEERVRERTDKLETVNKELSAFAYVVSHDLRAPLRAVSQLAGWILKDSGETLPKDSIEKMNLLISRVKRMDNFINGILQYSRIGRVSGKRDHLDLNVLVQEVISSLPIPDGIRVSIDTKLPWVWGDGIRLQQVFQNLINNALKFMDKPRGVVRISERIVDGYHEFQVEDNGPGIEEKYFDKIFQIFQTIETRDQRESTGIGLTLVKKIVEIYGGKIWLKSKPNEGSSFYFTLPMETEAKQISEIN